MKRHRPLTNKKNNSKKHQAVSAPLYRHPVSLVAIVFGGLAMVLLFSFISNRIEKADPLAAEVDRYKALYKRDTRVIFPEQNDYNEAKYELGKMLFFDPRFSSTGTMSCASCHNPGLSWTDSHPTAIGRANITTPRRTMALYNLAWDSGFTWDSTIDSLEVQSMMALMTEQGMAMNPRLMALKLEELKGYRPHFEKAFNLKPDEPIVIKHFHQAVATFERLIISEKAPFDYWVEGDEDAISQTAKEGFIVFNTKAQCASCHTGWRFSDGNLYNIGMGENDIGGGRMNQADASMRFTFKAVGLRNIAVRPPYMHDGRFRTMEEVIDFYDRGGDVKSENIAISPLGLTDAEKKALIEFLKTLTSKDKPVSIPHLPRG